MAYIYLFCSSLLMYFISGAANSARGEQEGAAFIFLLILTTVIAVIRTANTISERLYKKYSGESKKLTVIDLLVFDGAMYILYGLAAGFSHRFNDLSMWLLMIFAGCPTLIITSLVIVGRFKRAFELRSNKFVEVENEKSITGNRYAEDLHR
ncbi:MAG: hypothetical protein J1E40_07795 [Oscillospiraceae bacterium]|nr:hypothetical protein [Oscillospiraceae bacterium]